MLREEAHKLIDQLFDLQTPREEEPTEPVEKRELPKDKRAVRTKSSGDRVYLLDEVAKTRSWVNSSDPTVSSPEILDKLGFNMEDVVEIEDSELLRYQMSPPITNA